MTPKTFSPIKRICCDNLRTLGNKKKHLKVGKKELFLVHGYMLWQNKVHGFAKRGIKPALTHLHVRINISLHFGESGLKSLPHYKKKKIEIGPWISII